MATKSSCGECTFYAASETKAADTGVCHFNPPVFLTEEETKAKWPIVANNDWCGHFEGDRKSA
ncbi:hypothetical protein SAMN04488056_12012 [Cohaesibacter marisflavi]|uniref:Benzylsuccinate synthase n=1 Tax=Cohaesibacter marisflavi TaxID=655353 RepID=A0A1I5M8L2_9HYPH|nr:hypothetical protein [Cohaesibacter marisflavi]SFP05932.1 hypothetical protein SAMN04488056_12012 [Cohaesibacter marisflavi]